MGKRYQLNVVEEAVLNRNYPGYRACRVEIHDNTSLSPYATYEISVRLPEELFEQFREVFDDKEVDVLPCIYGHGGELTKKED